MNLTKRVVTLALRALLAWLADWLPCGCFSFNKRFRFISANLDFHVCCIALL